MEELEDQAQPAPKKIQRFRVDQLRLEVDEWGRKHYFQPVTGRPVCGRRRHKKNAEIENDACLAVPTHQGPCRVHGAGAGAPIKHGRYSKVLKQWKTSFDRAVGNAEILDVRPDLALMDVVLEGLAQRAEEKDSPSWRRDLRRAFDDLQAAMKARRQADVGKGLKKLGDLIEQGAAFEQVSRDLVRQLDIRANRAQRENEIALKKEETITLPQLTAQFGSWLRLLQEHLDAQSFARVLPLLRKLTDEQGLLTAGVPADEKDGE